MRFDSPVALAHEKEMEKHLDLAHAASEQKPSKGSNTKLQTNNG